MRLVPLGEVVLASAGAAPATAPPADAAVAARLKALAARLRPAVQRFAASKDTNELGSV